MPPSYQSKLKPISISTPSYAAKLKPIRPAPAPTAPVATPPTAATNVLGKVAKAAMSVVPGGGLASSMVPDSTAGDFTKGVVKGVGVPLIRTGAMIQKGLTLGKAGQGAYDTADKFEAQPMSTAEKVGNVTGQVLPFLMPSSAGEAVASKVASLIPKATSAFTKFANNAVPWLAKKGVQVGADTAVGTAQTGDVKQGGEIAAGGQLLSGLGTALKPIAKAGYEALSVPLSKAEANLVQLYRANVPFAQRIANAVGETAGPVTAANTAFRKGLFGTESMIGTQARKAQGVLWNKMIEPALSRSKTIVDMPKFFADAAANIVKKSKELGDREARTMALNSIMQEYKNKATATMKELQGYKEGWASHVPEKYYRGMDITQTYNNVRAELANLARTAIHSDLGPEAKQAYFDYGNLKSISQWGQNAMTGAKLKGGFGSFWNGVKDMVLTPIGTIGGHVLYKAGNGLEFVGRAGARVVNDIFNEGSQP